MKLKYMYIKGGEMMALIGIDLGTTNSLACVYQKGELILIPNQLKKY